MTRTDIACIGAAHMDRIARCREAFVWRASNPVTVMSSHGGVARNVALNLARLGQRVKLVSVLGEDEEGAAISAELCSAGVDLSDVTRLTGLSTASYTAVLDPTGELMVGLADADIYENLGAAHLKALMPSLAAWPFWVADANLPEAGIGALVEGAPNGVALSALAVSPAKALRLVPHLSHFDMLFANRAEASALLRRPVETATEALEAGEVLRALGPEQVFITLGADGVAVAASGMHEVLPALEARVVNVNGAGDAFAAGTLAALCTGAPVAKAVAAGLAAAALTAQSPDACSAQMSAASVAGAEIVLGN